MTVLLDADTQAVNDKLAQVLVNTEIVMEDVDKTDEEADLVKEKVDTLKIESQRSYRSILAGARRTAMVVRGLAVASGNAFAEIYLTGIEIALLTAELLIDVATAESLTVVGAVGAAAKIGTILALLKKAQQLRAGETEAAARTEGIVSAMSALTFGYIIDPIAALWLIIFLGSLL